MKMLRNFILALAAFAIYDLILDLLELRKLVKMIRNFRVRIAGDV